MIDFDQRLRNFKDIPIKIEGEEATLKVVSVAALLATFPDEQDLPGADKARRYALAKAIHWGFDSPSPDEVELLKRLIGRLFIPLIVGAAYELLEQAGAAPAAAEPAAVALAEFQAVPRPEWVPAKKRRQEAA